MTRNKIELCQEVTKDSLLADQEHGGAWQPQYRARLAVTALATAGDPSVTTLKPSSLLPICC